MVVVSVVVVMAIGAYAAYHIHMRRIRLRNESITKRLELYLTADDIQMWVYDTAREIFTTYNRRAEALEEYNRRGFSAFFNDEDYRRMLQHIDYMAGGGQATEPIMVRCHSTRRPDIDYWFSTKLSIFTTEKGRTRKILGTMKNVHDTHRRHMDVQELMLRYNTLFNAVDVDLAFFDATGHLTDVNDHLCHTFKIDNRQELLSRGLTIHDIPSFKDLDITTFEGRHCSIIAPQMEGIPPTVQYYEHEMIPLYNDNKMMGILSLGMDVTPFVHNTQAERSRETHIASETKKQHDYIRNINYALEVSKVWLTNYHPDTRTLEITRSYYKPVTHLTEMRALLFTADDDKKRVATLLRSMDDRKARRYSIEVATTLQRGGKTTYLRFNGFPVYGKDGRIDYYFGLCRDISLLTETNARLEEEMRRAREAEVVKTAFMKNVSYDIRTPLNSVVGFAQLFNFEHTEEDEQIFISEIRENSNTLLKLINDILYLSRLDANMVEINPRPTNIADTFATHCMTGWTRELKEGVRTILDDPYEELTVILDETQVGKMIELLAESAAHFTHEGTVRGRYEYHHGNLEICIEDTGVGIDKESLKLMFKTNNNVNTEQSATRLKLQICQKLSERMGGHMDIESELGKGTSIWVRIPCEATTIKKRRIKDGK